MAGEIQVNSVTALTESGSNILLNNVDTATNRTNLGLGSMATQDATSVSLTGGSITGTEFDLKSTGTSVYKSDGTTAVISESSGTVTVNNATLGSSTIFPAGHVLQVKQTLKTDFYSNTTNYSSWSDITGLSVSITPSSTSSKILVVVHLTGTANTNGMWMLGRVLRGTTPIGIGDSRGSSARAGFGWKHVMTAGDNNSGIESGSTMILDAPSTTSATTYKVQACNGNNTISGTWSINGTVNSGNSYNSSSVSSITVMEIAG